MLLWTYLLCLLAATFVASQTPEIRGDPEGVVDPSPGEPGQKISGTPHVIRELLRAREPSACDPGYGECSNAPAMSVLLLFLRFFSRPVS